VIVVTKNQSLYAWYGCPHGWNIQTGDAVFVLLAVILRHPDQEKILN